MIEEMGAKSSRHQEDKLRDGLGRVTLTGSQRAVQQWHRADVFWSLLWKSIYGS